MGKQFFEAKTQTYQRQFGSEQQKKIAAGFLDMPCMKKVCRDKRGYDPLVSSQEKRACLGLLINR